MPGITMSAMMRSGRSRSRRSMASDASLATRVSKPSPEKASERMSSTRLLSTTMRTEGELIGAILLRHTDAGSGAPGPSAPVCFLGPGHGTRQKPLELHAHGEDGELVSSAHDESRVAERDRRAARLGRDGREGIAAEARRDPALRVVAENGAHDRVVEVLV